jgi:hypothetical protein
MKFVVDIIGLSILAIGFHVPVVLYVVAQPLKTMLIEFRPENVK